MILWGGVGWGIWTQNKTKSGHYFNVSQTAKDKRSNNMNARSRKLTLLGISADIHCLAMVPRNPKEMHVVKSTGMGISSLRGLKVTTRLDS